MDCLTLWFSTAYASMVKHFGLSKKAALFLDVQAKLLGEVIFVSNEVGHGIVPLGELSRQFVDGSGLLHQALAQQVTRVEFVIAGLAQTLKSEKS